MNFHNIPLPLLNVYLTFLTLINSIIIIGCKWGAASLGQDTDLTTFLQQILRVRWQTARHSAANTIFSSPIIPFPRFRVLFPTFLHWKRRFRNVGAYNVLGGSHSFIALLGTTSKWQNIHYDSVVSIVSEINKTFLKQKPICWSIALNTISLLWQNRTLTFHNKKTIDTIELLNQIVPKNVKIFFNCVTYLPVSRQGLFIFK